MSTHLHETDRILATLGEAIENLRAIDLDSFECGLPEEVANDLALLHGAVSAEAERNPQAWRDPETMEWRGDLSLVPAQGDVEYQLPSGAKPKGIDVKVSEAGRRRFLRAVKDEEISDEVLRGEHREGDWDA